MPERFSKTVGLHVTVRVLTKSTDKHKFAYNALAL